MDNPPARDAASIRRPIVRLIAGRDEPCTDHLTVEEPLEIRLGDQPLAVTMRTPGHDDDLAAGFCLTEGVIDHSDQLESVAPCDAAEHGNVVNVTLTQAVARQCMARVDRASRQMYLSSSCGLCGKETIERIYQKLPPIRGDFQVSWQTLAALPSRMREAQATFEHTGGLHAAAAFDLDGTLKVLREDVGRHNAVDKVVGKLLLLGKLPADRMILLVSGRASFEIMQKAAMAGFAVVCAVSAPSSLAVDFAQQTGQTLVGFLRDDRMNLYAGPQRVIR